jgi:hypothetical protein
MDEINKRLSRRLERGEAVVINHKFNELIERIYNFI